MRENIGLYRGKRIDNGELVEGYLVTAAIAGKRVCIILVPCEGKVQLDGRSLRLALDAIENGRKIAGISDINGNSYFVDPESLMPQAEWHLFKDEEILIAECLNCGMVVEATQAAWWNYCPNCGARMTPAGK